MGEDASTPGEARRLDELAGELGQLLEEAGARALERARQFDLQGRWREREVTLRARALRGGPISFARVVRVDGQEAMQALNLLVFGRAELGSPILGCEILTFGRGVHLFVLDAWPTSPPLHPSLQEAMRAQREALGARFELLAPPAWGREVFSDQMIFVKPGARAAAPSEAFMEPVRQLTRAVLARAQEAPGLEAPARGEALARRARFLRTHAEDEPVGPFLERLASPEWVERFNLEFLYPTWLRRGDEAPRWADDAPTLDAPNPQESP